MLIKQEFWHSAFWQKCRNLIIIKSLGFVYRKILLLRNRILSSLLPPYVAFSAKKKTVRQEPYDFGEVYVSLTTYPARINECFYTICSILAQSAPANKIVLTLTKEEFPNGEKDIPLRILNLKGKGLEFIWANENLKPHNKYFYAMQKYPQATIITVDDDIIYSSDAIKKLISSYISNKNAVIALCTDQYQTNKGTVLPYSQAYHNFDSIINVPRFDLAAEGFAGVLYPPSILPAKTFDTALIKECAPLADDIWLKFMELLSNVPVVCATIYKDPIVVTKVQDTALNKINSIQNQNDIQFYKILSTFSNINFYKKITQ